MAPLGCCENKQQGVGVVGQQLAGTTVTGSVCPAAATCPGPALQRPSPLLPGHLPPELAWPESHCLSAAFSIQRGSLTHLLAPLQTAVSADTRPRRQRQGPWASRWPRSVLLFLPSSSIRPCHGLIPPYLHAKPSPSPTAYFFFLFSFSVDCLRPWGMSLSQSQCRSDNNLTFSPMENGKCSLHEQREKFPTAEMRM